MPITQKVPGGRVNQSSLDAAAADVGAEVGDGVLAFIAVQVAADDAALDLIEAAAEGLPVMDDLKKHVVYQRATCLVEAGKPAEAEAMIAALRRTYGGSAQLVAYHARLLRGLGRDAEALEAALACSQSPVPFPTCRELAVEILIDEGREGEAGERLLEWSDPDDLDAIVMMALRKEPKRRYASVEQLSDDLRRFRVGLPVIARPDTFSYRTSSSA